ncbi:flagellar hook-basal body complex protein [Sulfuricurvum sp.]|uniref:flagellar hook-basal body complex protein n=1 Tax=Sulfuricurvum sp. TaxID=2025608 RepID=UPI002620EF16|nr:flagellar hook-basal body complex protein [Sulfuricurvum sp.]MDD2265788.1 flagellar hook-basal body complex protein [Sulfuricurvum sp.]MDD2783115.1 flagellar hook-basal body complex protein [Sulfuricurvum sp.]
MMKALDSGVTGLQSHQIAMDVESNNIANVNTVGFKYSRANFSDLLAQTNQIATAPQGSLGGKNAVQIGLGTTINSVTKIMSQGSIQNTDKNTDVAIQGDGFFIVSPDGGNTYKYTRSGDFKFDAAGNFVDNNGFIVQGWVRDPKTGLVDATAPISNIQIPPGLTTPAQASSQVVVKANLSASTLITQYSPTYETSPVTIPVVPATTPPTFTAIAGDPVNTNGAPASPEDMGIMFDASGRAFSLASAATTGTGPGTGGDGIFISTDGGNTYAEFRYTSNSADVGSTGAPGVATSPLKSDGTASTNANVYYFNTTKDFQLAVADWVTTNALNEHGTPAVTGTSPGATVNFNPQGKLQISNQAGANDLSIQVAGIADTNTVKNDVFTSEFLTLSGNITAGSSSAKQSQSVNAATHSASIDVYDSLGSKHTLKIDFRKESSNPVTGTSWSYTVTVPKPANIGGQAPYENILNPAGLISFNSTGGLAGYNIPAIDFTGNNGSKPNQSINLNFGSINGFDGITSFDNPSGTSGISQDGFPGGDLQGVRIDQSGTLVGSFSNGRSFGLAQIGMAKFANNEGLTSDGGNVYLQSANSGDPIIGTAATAGRGFMQASALEASNVDLSKSLTNLIVIQRGYQANAKTITTADTLLETLLGIKR